MNLTLTEAERAQLRVLQKQRRDEAGYVKATVVLLLDKGCSVASVAEDLGLDEATVYRYAQAYQTQWLAHCQEVNRTLYLNCKGMQAWLREACQVDHAICGLTDLLGFS